MAANAITDGAPAATVVVASFSGEDALARCLTSLAQGAASAEVVVATTAPPEAVSRLALRFPAVRFFQSAPGTSVFSLRSLGVAHARGQLIVLTEDHCTVAPGWLEALVKAHEGGHAVVGGPIDNAPDRRTYDWALYWCEYSAYMSPLPDGPVSALLAANVSYRREALWDIAAAWQDGFYDNEVHDALGQAGHVLYQAEKAVVHSHLRMSLRQAVAHLFTGGRRFGSYRRFHSSRAARLFWALASPAVPLVLLARLVRRVASRRPARLGTLILGLPAVLTLLLAWSVGETCGYFSSGLVPVPSNQP